MKLLFSRLRFIGFAFVSPSGLLLFSNVFNRWRSLQKAWVQTLIYAPGVITTLITLGLFDRNALVYGHTPFEYLGVSVLQFKNGLWFSVHYIWSTVLTSMLMTLLIQSAIAERARRRAILFVAFGVAIGMIIDIYCVATNSPLRWLMLSAGTFAITELALLYASRQHDLFGILTTGKIERNKLQEINPLDTSLKRYVG